MKSFNDILDNMYSSSKALCTKLCSNANSDLQLGSIFVGYLLLALSILPIAITRVSFALAIKAFPLALSIGVSPAITFLSIFIPTMCLGLWAHSNLCEIIISSISERSDQLFQIQKDLDRKEKAQAWSKLNNDKDGFWNGVSPANKQQMQSNPKFRCSLTGDVMRDPVYIVTSSGEHCYYDYENLIADYKVNTEIGFMEILFGMSRPYIPLATREPMKLSDIQHDPELKAEINAAKGFSVWNAPHYLTYGFKAACTQAESFKNFVSSSISSTKPDATATKAAESVNKGTTFRI